MTVDHHDFPLVEPMVNKGHHSLPVYGVQDGQTMMTFFFPGDSTCNCLRWTNFISADNPGGQGDYETLGPPDERGNPGTIHHVRPVSNIQRRLSELVLNNFRNYLTTLKSFSLQQSVAPHAKLHGEGDGHTLFRNTDGE